MANPTPMPEMEIGDWVKRGRSYWEPPIVQEVRETGVVTVQAVSAEVMPILEIRKANGTRWLRTPEGGKPDDR